MDYAKKIKHLEMIEGIIERMAKNSFQLKTWTMTLVVLIGGMASKDSERKLIIIGFIPILIFWLLDSYYLRLERQYRILYKTVIEKQENEIDFSMDFTQIQNLSISESKKICFLNCFLSITEIVFYLPITVSLSVVMYMLHIWS